MSGDADLRLRGSVARPSVLGRADILEGDATFNGIKFRLERGDITFANPVAIEPQVNLQATTHVRNYDLDVTVTGTPDRLNVNYRSEPPLPKSDIIALLALGRTSEESEQLQQQSGQTVFTDEATNLIINQAINSTVSSRMQKLFGVSRIKIDPQGLTTETNPTARGPQVTIEQQFANNLSLTYSTNVSQSSQQIIQGEYYINRNVSVRGHARSERRGQLRRPRAAAQEIELSTRGDAGFRTPCHDRLCRDHRIPILRRRMVESQLRARGIADERVLDCDAAGAAP